MVAVAADVGQGGEDLEVIRERALACGAVEAVVVDAREEFADDFCLPALRANALYMNRYPLVSALSRPVIVKHLVAAAHRYGASVVAHGCTGKGNDQVRFEVGVGALAPDLSVIAPVRDSGMTRDKAIAFAEERGLPIDVTKKSPYSIDQNVWGRAVETGFLEDVWNAPIEDVYSYTAGPGSRARTRRGADQLRRRSTDRDRRPAGRPCSRRSRSSTIGPAHRASAGWTWSRTGWSASRAARSTRHPGAIALIEAHRHLEDLTLEKDAARFKRPIEQRWAELAYDGLWFSPLKRALDAFIDETSRNVSGDIRMTLHGGRAVVTGRRSEASLYDYSLATYDAEDTFDQRLAKGFVELWGMPSRIAAQRD